MTKEQLQEYFCRDKSDWFIINNGGQKVWDIEKVDEFWEKIRIHKMDNKDYNFDNYVFPKFQRNGSNPSTRDSTFRWDFWDKRQITDFDKEASFISAKFLGPALFSSVKFERVNFVLTVFEENVQFDNCIFSDVTRFAHFKFQESVSFCGAKFTARNKWIEFSSIIFEHVSDFRNVVFDSRVRFVNDKFNLRTLFINAVFNEEVDFKHNNFVSSIDLANVQFFKKVLFESNTFNKVNLEMVNKKEFNYFGKVYPPKPPIIHFVNSYFNADCVILNADLKNISFDNCDVTDLSFKRCDWVINKDRLVTNEEGRELKDSEEHYRQLKRNFDNKKNWEMSGLAYVSEMEIRQKRLWDENNYYNWFIYWFYGYFAGYTQDFKKPILSIVALISISTLLYYFIDFNIVRGFQRSLKGALPYLEIGIEKPFTGYWLIIKNVEAILGGTFLAFFVLALRKRFKQ